MNANDITNEALDKAGRFMRAGEVNRAISVLENATKAGSNSSKLWTVLAMCYQRTGKSIALEEALEAALALDPANVKALILQGASAEQRGQLTGALKKYTAALSHQGSIPAHEVTLLRELDKVRAHIPYLSQALEQKTYDELNKIGFEPGDKDKRFDMALDILFGRKEVFYQEPHQFYYPELPQRQFYNPKEFLWMEELKNNWQSIRDEAKTVMECPDLFAPYLKSDPSQATSEEVELLDNTDWSAYYLIKDSVKQEDNIKRCPVTMNSLKKAPLDFIPGRTPSVLYSLLYPHTHIPPHTGMLNTRLICHLPLVVPKNCKFRVGNETIEWVEGEPIAFDDSINHEAWNNSNEKRIILLFEIWRPELSERERVLISKIIELGG